MPVLRDFVCPNCGQLDEDVYADARTCECGAAMEIVCNGGMNSRYRFCDFPADPDFYKGQVKAGAVSVDGNVTLDNGDDKREAARDKAYFNSRKRRGKETLVFDQTKG